MPRKSRPSLSRKSNHICKHCTNHHRNHSYKKHSHKKHKHCKHSRSRRTRRSTRRRGGSCSIQGSPVDENLAGSWSSRMSQGQGEDYLKYHEGQHGGACSPQGAPLSSIDQSSLSSDLRGPAMLNGLDGAFEYIKGMSDMNGGKYRRRRSQRRHRSQRSQRSQRRSIRQRRQSRRSRKQSHRRQRKRGGSCSELGYSPFPSQGMLLSSDGYAKAGLNPEWKTNAEFDAAAVRETQ